MVLPRRLFARTGKSPYDNFDRVPDSVDIVSICPMLPMAVRQSDRAGVDLWCAIGKERLRRVAPLRLEREFGKAFFDVQRRGAADFFAKRVVGD